MKQMNRKSYLSPEIGILQTVDVIATSPVSDTDLIVYGEDGGNSCSWNGFIFQ